LDAPSNIQATYRNPPLAHGMLRRAPHRALIDAIGEANGADGKTCKRLRKERFRPAIARWITSPGRVNARMVVEVAAMPDENSVQLAVRS
jgi:hypothetical protein